MGIPRTFEMLAAGVQYRFILYSLALRRQLALGIFLNQGVGRPSAGEQIKYRSALQSRILERGAPAARIGSRDDVVAVSPLDLDGRSWYVREGSRKSLLVHTRFTWLSSCS
jgi:hypothetical protein